MASGSCCKNVKVWSKRLNHVFLQILLAQDEENGNFSQDSYYVRTLLNFEI